MQARPGLSARPDLLPIDEVARRLEMSVSALRYYDERGLVTPTVRARGRRWYGAAEVRQLTVVKIAHDIGFPLEVVRALLQDARAAWEPVVREQVAELERLVARARAAQSFLAHVLDCGEDRPTQTCASLTAALDELAGGRTVADLAQQHSGIRVESED